MILLALLIGISVFEEKKILRRKLRRIAREYAEGLVKRLDATVCNPLHEYIQVDASTFSHLDKHFYDTSATILTRQGFTMLRDVENLTMKETIYGVSAHAFLRLMIGEQGTIVVALYLLCPEVNEETSDDASNADKGTVECVTEFSDGVFLMTNNMASFHNVFTSPPAIHVESHPLEASLASIVASHKNRILHYCETHQGIQPCRVNAWEDVLLQMHRIQSYKATYRKALGRISKDELRQLGTQESHIIDHAKWVDAIYQEIQRINQKTGMGASTSSASAETHE
jgi:hypothetical protein